MSEHKLLNYLEDAVNALDRITARVVLGGTLQKGVEPSAAAGAVEPERARPPRFAGSSERCECGARAHEPCRHTGGRFCSRVAGTPSEDTE